MTYGFEKGSFTVAAGETLMLLVKGMANTRHTLRVEDGSARYDDGDYRTQVQGGVVYALPGTAPIINTKLAVQDGVLKVMISGLNPNTQYTVKVADGAAKYGSTHYRTQLTGGYVASTAPGSGRGATFENVVVKTDDYGSVFFSIKLAAGTQGMDFEISINGMDYLKKTILIADKNPDAPDVQTRVDKTIQKGENFNEPTETLMYSYTLSNRPTEVQVLHLSDSENPTAFPGNVDVEVWDSASPTIYTPLLFSVDVTNIGIASITSAVVDGKRLDFEWKNNRWEAVYFAVNTSQPGLGVNYPSVLITENDFYNNIGAPRTWTADIKTWSFNSVTGTWITNVHDYPGLVLHVAVKQATSQTSQIIEQTLIAPVSMSESTSETGFETAALDFNADGVAHVFITTGLESLGKYFRVVLSNLDVEIDSATVYIADDDHSASKICVNDNGTIRTLEKIQVNDGGVIRTLKKIQVNNGGEILEFELNSN